MPLRGSVLVLGATGHTGRLVARALARRGVPTRLAARDVEAAAEVAAEVGRPMEVVACDVTDPDSVLAAVRGVGAVVNTVGPFVRHGEAVVSACVTAGVNYLDTSAEQAWVRRVRDRYEARARSAGIVVLPAHGADFAFSYASAALLDDRMGPLASHDTWHDLGNFRPTRGTAKSMLAMMEEPQTGFSGGREVPWPRPWGGELVAIVGRGSVWSTPFPGGDVALLPSDYPSLYEATSNLVLSRLEAAGVGVATSLLPALRHVLGRTGTSRLEQLVDERLQDSDARAPWKVHARGRGPGGEMWCHIEGGDTYGDTAEVAALAGQWLAEGRARAFGVRTTGAVFDAQAFLDGLKDCGITYRLQRPVAYSGTTPP